MKGCLSRIGCLTILVLLAVAAYLTRDRWRAGAANRRAAPAAEIVWEPLTAAGASRARVVLDRLARPTGPVYANVSGADIASYVFESLSKQLPPSADSVASAVIGERLYIRASVRLRDLGGNAVLGPIAGMLGDRERMQFGGTFHVIRPGLAEYQVQDVIVRDIGIPRTMIPRLLRQIERGGRPDGLAPDGLPIVIPLYLADVRIGRGRVTLYRTTP